MDNRVRSIVQVSVHQWRRSKTRANIPMPEVSSISVTMQKRFTLALYTVNSTKTAWVYTSNQVLSKRYCRILQEENGGINTSALHNLNVNLVFGETNINDPDFT